MKIKSITRNKRKASVYDIETPCHNYILANGIISHNTMEMFSKAVMSGGTGGMYSANQVFIIGKAQDKDGTDLVGWNFTINIEKSRFVREKAKFPFLVKFEGGISKWSGLLPLALESGHVIKPKMGWYQTVNLETGEVSEKNYREKATNNGDFWAPILSSKSFQEFVYNRFAVGVGSLIEEEDDVEDTLENLEEE